MCKRLLILVLVLGLASIASAVTIVEADFEDLAIGDLNGQGGGSEWSANWNGHVCYDVVQESGNKYVRHIGTADGNNMNRSITTFSAGEYSFLHQIRFSDPIETWGTTSPFEIQFSDTVGGGGTDPIHVKYDPTGTAGAGILRVGNENMLDLVVVHTETINATWGGGSEADYWKDPVGSDWVNVWLAVDADAVDKSNAIAVYWELNDDSMGYVGLGTIQSGNETTAIKNIRITGTCAVGMTIDVDNLNVITGLIPEPATIALLGFGGLTLLRRKK